MVYTPDQKIRRAKKYGLAHGYHGAPGGWIYNASGTPVCQGWFTFYGQNCQRIDAWFSEPR